MQTKPRKLSIQRSPNQAERDQLFVVLQKLLKEFDEHQQFEEFIDLEETKRQFMSLVVTTKNRIGDGGNQSSMLSSRSLGRFAKRPNAAVEVQSVTLASR